MNISAILEKIDRAYQIIFHISEAQYLANYFKKDSSYVTMSSLGIDPLVDVHAMLAEQYGFSDYNCSRTISQYIAPFKIDTLRSSLTMLRGALASHEYFRDSRDDIRNTQISYMALALINLEKSLSSICEEE